jgi:hypothetical protein
MTPEELRKHRREICEALIEGKQCQAMYCGEFQDYPARSIANELFASSLQAGLVRIKPQPRQCWVGWSNDTKGAWCRDTKEGVAELSKEFPDIKWQLVVENTGE